MNNYLVFAGCNVIGIGFELVMEPHDYDTSASTDSGHYVLLVTNIQVVKKPNNQTVTLAEMYHQLMKLLTIFSCIN